MATQHSILWLLCITALLACADIGNEPPAGDETDTGAPTTATDTGTVATDNAPAPTDTAAEDTEPEPIEIPVPDIVPEEVEVDPDAPWICTDEGFVDPIQEHSCDWTWSCNSGEYVISCTLQGSNYQCLCKIMNSTVGKYWSEELCAAQSTKNLANAVCKWQLPL